MIMQVHTPLWNMTAKPVVQSSGLGCSCGGQCEPCKRGMGDWSDDLMGMLSSPVNLGFVTLPVWVIGGAALLLAWWLLTPGGSDYRRQSKQLRSKYRGTARIRRAAERAAGDLL